MFTNHFSGPVRAIGPLFVCLSLRPDNGFSTLLSVLLIVVVIRPYRGIRRRPTYIARCGLLLPMFRGLSVVCVSVCVGHKS